MLEINVIILHFNQNFIMTVQYNRVAIMFDIQTELLSLL